MANPLKITFSVGFVALASAPFATTLPVWSVRTLHPKVISDNAIKRAKASHSRIRIDAKADSISVQGRTAKLVVVTGPANDMLSYRIDGLRNPRLILTPGAKLTILFVNADDDMVHDLRFTSQTSPFGQNPSNVPSFGSARLPHKSAEGFYSQTLVVIAPKQVGMYQYFCSTQGHAAGGMFGKVLVKEPAHS